VGSSFNGQEANNTLDDWPEGLAPQNRTEHWIQSVDPDSLKKSLKGDSMNKKNLGGALVASLALPLMLATISAPIANAASVSSSVATIDNCKWVMANIPSAIELSAAGDAKYTGDALAVSDSINGPTLGLSGTVATVASSDANSECSFYNAVLNATLSAQLDGVAFTASYGESGTPDASMDFDLAVGAELVITPDISLCSVPDGWTSGTLSFSTASTQQLMGFTSATDEYAASEAPRCSPPSDVTLTIPQRTSVPEGAGSNYAFQGPTITFTSTPSNSYDYVAASEPTP
jgi:hypothetical protein